MFSDWQHQVLRGVLLALLAVILSPRRIRKERLTPYQVQERILTTEGRFPSDARLPFVLRSGSAPGQQALIGLMLIAACMVHPTLFDALVDPQARTPHCLTSVSTLLGAWAPWDPAGGPRWSCGDGSTGDWLSVLGLLAVSVAWMLVRLRKKWRGPKLVTIDTTRPHTELASRCVALAHPTGVQPSFAEERGGLRAYALGFRSAPVVVIGRTIRKNLLDPPHRAGAEAVIRHELAHLVLGDVGLTAVSNAMRRIFTWAVLGPVAVLSFLGGMLRGDLSMLLFALGTIVVLTAVWLTHLALQRSREYRADALARAWGRRNGTTALRQAITRQTNNDASPENAGQFGPELAAVGFETEIVCEGTLGMGLANTRTAPEQSAHEGQARRTRDVTSSHPSAETRLAAAQEPRVAMQLGVVEPLLLGMCLVWLWAPFASPAGLASNVPIELEILGLVASVPCGLSLWNFMFRSGLAAEGSRGPHASWWLTPSAFALGVGAGELLSPNTAVERAAGIPLSASGLLTACGVLATAAWLFGAWAFLLSRAWARLLVRTRDAAKAALVPTIFAMCALLGGCVVLLTLRAKLAFPHGHLRGNPADAAAVLKEAQLLVAPLLTRQHLPLCLIGAFGLLAAPSMYLWKRVAPAQHQEWKEQFEGRLKRDRDAFATEAPTEGYPWTGWRLRIIAAPMLMVVPPVVITGTLSACLSELRDHHVDSGVRLLAWAFGLVIGLASLVAGVSAASIVSEWPQIRRYPLVGPGNQALVGSLAVVWLVPAATTFALHGAADRITLWLMCGLALVEIVLFGSHATGCLTTSGEISGPRAFDITMYSSLAATILLLPTVAVLSWNHPHAFGPLAHLAQQWSSWLGAQTS